MGEAGPIGLPEPRVQDHESPLPRLAALRLGGAQRLDPARFHYMEMLSQRLEAQPDAVRRILEGKLKDALAAYGDIALVARPDGLADARPTCTPLARLNQHIRNATGGGSDREQGGDGDAAPELKSVRRFRDTWHRISAEQLVDQAVGRGPENAGPLNSHRLVLRSLAKMRSLSPDYLRRFMAHVDSLMWLEQAARSNRPAAAKPKTMRLGRQKKSR